MSEQRYNAEVMSELEREEYEAEQDALPPHKRDGYAERIADLADRMRDEDDDFVIEQYLDSVCDEDNGRVK